MSDDTDRTIDNADTVSDTQVLLIDLENCPQQLYTLMANLSTYSQIAICYAQSSAKIPLDWIVPLTATVTEGRLKIVKMPHGGKNAADFGITFWAGVLMAQLPESACFDIVSDDADLDFAVSLLQGLNRNARRIGAVKKETAEVSAVVPIKAAVRDYCNHLAEHNRNRPVKKETLLNSIRSKFKNGGVDPEALFQALIKEGAIELKDNRIGYHQQRIETLAHTG